jgi:hypothetical protein
MQVGSISSFMLKACGKSVAQKNKHPAGCFLHLGEHPVFAIYNPADVAQLLRLALDVVGRSFANRSDD